MWYWSNLSSREKWTPVLSAVILVREGFTAMQQLQWIVTKRNHFPIRYKSDCWPRLSVFCSTSWRSCVSAQFIFSVQCWPLQLLMDLPNQRNSHTTFCRPSGRWPYRLHLHRTQSFPGSCHLEIHCWRDFKPKEVYI